MAEQRREARRGRGAGVMRTLVQIAAGAGLAVGGAYLASRVQQKKARETRIDRLEQMLAELERERATRQ
jgi:hypothetical protein